MVKRLDADLVPFIVKKDNRGRIIRTRFSGHAGGELLASIQQTSEGLSYLEAGSNIVIVSASNGQVTISSTAGGGAPSGPAGGDLAGTYPNPTVTDLTIASEATGDLIYFNGTNWVRRAPTTNGFVLTLSTGIPVWAAAAGGAPTNAQYLTLATDGTLSDERVLTAGSGLESIDAGAGSTLTLNLNGTVARISGSAFTGNISAPTGSFFALTGSVQRTEGGISYIAAGANVTVTSASNGQITISAPGAGGAPIAAQYLTLAADGTLSDERVFTPGSGLTATDAGAGGNYTLDLDGTVARISGSAFSGNVSAPTGSFWALSGSLTRTTTGISFIQAGENVTVSSASNGQITISATDLTGAPTNAQYLTLALDGTLSDERVLTAGSGLESIDAGAGSTLTLNLNGTVARISGSAFTGNISAPTGSFFALTGSVQRTEDGLSYIAAGENITVVSASNGQITISSTDTVGAPTNVQYLTLATDGTLSDERVLTAGSGLESVDGGAGSTLTLNLNGTVARISGSAFTGNISAPTGSFFALTGSVQRTEGGLSYIAAGENITVVSASNGQITISATAGGGAPTTAQYVTLALDGSLSAERVLTAGSGITLTDAGANGNATLDLNGTVARISGSAFSGDISAPTGSFWALSGSLTRTTAGLSYIEAGTNITVVSASSGQITISATGGGGAPVGAQYLTLATDATLTDERVLTAGSGLESIDAGAGSTLTLNLNGTVARISGSAFTGNISAPTGSFFALTGSVQRTEGGLSYLVAGDSILIESQSNGQVIISADVDAIAARTDIHFVPTSASVSGTINTIIGSLFITAQTYSLARAMMGSTGIDDISTLRIQSFTTAASILTLTGTFGTADVVATSSVIIPSSEWYDVVLSNSSISGSATCLGLKLY